jgi:hypothetical protein
MTANAIISCSFQGIGQEDSVGLSVCLVHISATRWPIYCCPPEKEGNSKEPLEVALKSPALAFIYGHGCQ